MASDPVVRTAYHLTGTISSVTLFSFVMQQPRPVDPECCFLLKGGRATLKTARSQMHRRANAGTDRATGPRGVFWLARLWVAHTPSAAARARGSAPV